MPARHAKPTTARFRPLRPAGGPGRGPFSPISATSRNTRLPAGLLRRRQRTGLELIQPCQNQTDGRLTNLRRVTLRHASVESDRERRPDGRHITGKSTAQATDGSPVSPSGLPRHATGHLTPTTKPLLARSVDGSTSGRGRRLQVPGHEPALSHCTRPGRRVHQYISPTSTEPHRRPVPRTQGSASTRL